MTQPSIARFCLLTAGALALPTLGFAGHGHTGKESKPLVEKVSESCITGDIGIDIVSQYIRHGIVQENQGAILQPYVDLYFKIYEGDGALSKVSVDLSFWNSFHSRHTRAIPGSTTASWYEADFQAGLSFTLMKNFVLSPYYKAYLSPNDAFEQSHDVGLRLGYDDTDLWGGGFSLHPYFLVEFDVDGTTGNGGDEGIYYEVGISPRMQWGALALSLPIKAGFGSSDYYAGDHGYGFFSVGVSAEYKLGFVPSCLGAWTIHGDATYYHLGEGTEIAGVPDIRDRDENEWVFGGGLRVAF